MRIASSAIASLAILSLTACDPTTTEPEDAGADAPRMPRDGGPDTREPYDAGSGPRIPESEAAAGREGCAYERGAMPWETIGEEFPIGAEIPIRHFILVMQENRSFDHYFGAMEGVDGITPEMSNPEADGTPVPAFHTDEYCIDDPHHGWTATHGQWNDGANDGFVTHNGENGARAMGYLTEEDLPFYYDLYSRFAMSDHHFCSVLGPTWPNREYYLAASSFGMTGNDPIARDRYVDAGDRIIFHGLERAGVDWRIYHSTVPFVWGAFASWAFAEPARGRTRDLERFYEDIENGELPEVAWVDPTWSLSSTQTTDEHPPANPQIGQAWLRDLVTRVMASPQWAETAIIITYDEHGGFWDHAPPPEACPPGDYPAEGGGGDGFDRLGIRVPFVIVSPYSRAGYVSDRVTDHASILRLLEARYLLPAMTGRDANAWPLLDMFDFEGVPFMTPPTDLAAAPVNEARNEACRSFSE